MRRHYIDNLRWAVILLLIPFHAAQAWKIWDEPNYIVFGPNRVISSIIVFFAPFVMQLLFLFAGMSIRFALRSRTYGQFAAERIKRLLVPLVFGLLVLVPPMTYLADRFNNGYSGSFFSHYAKFFTYLTDMSGADGGFSFGQFWFLLYLLILSFVLLGVIVIQKKILPDKEIKLPFFVIILLGLPLPLFSELLSVGGKSFVEFFYLLLIGYYIFIREDVLEKLEKYAYPLLAVGLVASIVNVYLFIFSGTEYPVANTVANNLSKWFMVLALIGVGRRLFDCENRVTRFLTSVSYPFFSFHFVFVILFQYLFAEILNGNTVLLYLIPVALAYLATFICSYLSTRATVLCFLVGVKKRR